MQIKNQNNCNKENNNNKDKRENFNQERKDLWIVKKMINSSQMIKIQIKIFR